MVGEFKEDKKMINHKHIKNSVDSKLSYPQEVCKCSKELPTIGAENPILELLIKYHSNQLGQLQEELRRHRIRTFVG